MKEKFILIIKGFIVGVGKIIPGVSGAMLAITLGIYDKCIYAISNFTKNIKNNLNLLFFIGIGIILSVGLFSNMVIYLLDSSYFITMCFFIGLIIGGVPKLYNESKVNVKNKKNIGFIIISFLIILVINYINPEYVIKTNANFITLISIGILEAFAMVVPGISGTALLMLIGYYDMVLIRFSRILNIFNLYETISFFLPFGIGLLIGILIVSKLINFCFRVYKNETYCIIFGLLFSSIFILIIKMFEQIPSVYEIVIGILLSIMGYFVSNFLDKKFTNK